MAEEIAAGQLEEYKESRIQALNKELLLIWF